MLSLAVIAVHDHHKYLLIITGSSTPSAPRRLLVEKPPRRSKLQILGKNPRSATAIPTLWACRGTPSNEENSVQPTCFHPSLHSVRVLPPILRQPPSVPKSPLLHASPKAHSHISHTSVLGAVHLVAFSSQSKHREVMDIAVAGSNLAQL